MSCSEVPSSGLGRASQPKRKGHFLFLDRCRLHLSKGVQRLAQGAAQLCVSPATTECLTLPRLLMSWAKQGKERGLKFTGDTNLEGAGNTSSKREGKQSVEGEVRNPDK